MNRDFYIDQTKGLLMFLVVFAHISIALHENPVWGGVTNVIYAFHMPAFMFLSGYLSKGVKSHRVKDLNSLLYPFLVFQILYSLFYCLNGSVSYSFSLFTPVYLTWYMISLFFCRLFLPYLTMIKTKSCVVILIVLMSISGFFVNNSFLAFYRTLYFLPIFYLGYITPNLNEIMKKLYPYRWWVLTLFTAISVVIFYLSSLNEGYYEKIHWYITTDIGYKGSWMTAGFKMIGFVLSLFMSLAFFMFCYILFNKKTGSRFLGEVGRNSMCVYVIHGFIVVSSVHLFMKYIPAVWGILCGLVLSLFLCWILSRERIVKLFQFLFDFNKISELLKIKIYK